MADIRIKDIARTATLRSGEKIETDHATDGSGKLDLAEFIALRNALAAAPALVFDASNPATMAVAGPGLLDFSVEAKCAFLRAVGSNEPILSGTAGSALEIIRNAGGQIEIRSTAVGTAAYTDGTPVSTTGADYDIVVKRTSGVYAISVDGKAVVATTALDRNLVGLNELVGAGLGLGNAQIRLSALRVWNYALSTTEIADLFATGRVKTTDRIAGGVPAVKTAADGVTHGGASLLDGTLTFSGTNQFLSIDNVFPSNPKFGTKVLLEFDYNAATSGIVSSPGEAYVANFVGNTAVYTDLIGNGSYAITLSVDRAGKGLELKSAGTFTGTIFNLKITPFGVVFEPDFENYRGGPQVMDRSGNGCDLNLPGDGVTGGVVPAVPGVIPSPFRFLRATSGYLIADQVVIPPGCGVRIYAKGDGTFSLGDSSGTPASIVNAQTAAAAMAPIAQVAYVTANRKLYLTLGTATSVAVFVEFFLA
jgi:hypothetical protein